MNSLFLINGQVGVLPSSPTPSVAPSVAPSAAPSVATSAAPIRIPRANENVVVQWDGPYEAPLVAASAAALPDGRVLM